MCFPVSGKFDSKFRKIDSQILLKFCLKFQWKISGTLGFANFVKKIEFFRRIFEKKGLVPVDTESNSVSIPHSFRKTYRAIFEFRGARVCRKHCLHCSYRRHFQLMYWRIAGPKFFEILRKKRKVVK